MMHITGAASNTPPQAMMACVSHAPIILLRPRAPAAEPEISALADRFRRAVEVFEPEQVIFFGNNHFAGFHYANMPAFCIGTECSTVADLVPATEAPDTDGVLRTEIRRLVADLLANADQDTLQLLAQLMSRLSQAD